VFSLRNITTKIENKERKQLAYYTKRSVIAIFLLPREELKDNDKLPVCAIAY
jgi:hypothetical protein